MQGIGVAASDRSVVGWTAACAASLWVVVGGE
jgi:hypothetical protein